MDGATGSWAADPGGRRRVPGLAGGDPRSRKGALLRAQALSMMSESAQALGPTSTRIDFEASRKPSRFAGLSRRQALTWTGRRRGGVPRWRWAWDCRRRRDRDQHRAGRDPPGAVEGRLDRAAEHARAGSGSNTSERRASRHPAEGRGLFLGGARRTRPFVVEVDGRRLRTSAGGVSGPQAGRRSGRCSGEPGPGRCRGSEAAFPLIVGAGANTRLILSDVAAEHPQLIAPRRSPANWPGARASWPSRARP
jgi:transmembrane sensor